MPNEAGLRDAAGVLCVDALLAVEESRGISVHTSINACGVPASNNPPLRLTQDLDLHADVHVQQGYIHGEKTLARGL